jgi:hypothetical protein
VPWWVSLVTCSSDQSLEMLEWLAETAKGGLAGCSCQALQGGPQGSMCHGHRGKGGGTKGLREAAAPLLPLGTIMLGHGKGQPEDAVSR